MQGWPKFRITFFINSGGTRDTLDSKLKVVYFCILYNLYELTHLFQKHPVYFLQHTNIFLLIQIPVGVRSNRYVIFVQIYLVLINTFHFNEINISK